ncbi:MAG TPA: GGDEF domain-containing protein [Eoetvoesiella sp.]
MSSLADLSVAAIERPMLDESINVVWLTCLKEILQNRLLSAVFQPILHVQSRTVIGYEGLIRGPADGPLHTPVNLFRVAGTNDLTLEVENLCCRVILERFSELKLPGKLFLNIGPECFVLLQSQQESILAYLDDIGLGADRIVFELTEGPCPITDNDVLRDTVMRYREMGFQIALDDLGQGYSSLRRWSELQPEYVKIDMHFIQGLQKDAVKQQFVKSIQEIAQKARATIIAEGIETLAELQCIRDLGIACGQGYFIARPHAHPLKVPSDNVNSALTYTGPSIQPKKNVLIQNIVTAHSLLRTVSVATPQMNNSQVYDIFSKLPDLQTIPVVDNGTPLGIITRASLIDRFARPYQRELYGKKPCTIFMDANPLIADKDTSLQKLSHILVEADQYRLISDFIITDRGQYLGIGTSHDLLRELTELQISAAKYANPLTLLPGSVPINQHIDHLLQNSAAFCACYADLDNFKPFNDVFGYRKGDDIIQLTGQILAGHSDAERDFVGHIGGDDFLVLFQSADWEARCQGILDAFGEGVAGCLDDETANSKGYFAENRKGDRQFYPLPSLSLGVVKVDPMQYDSHHQIALAASEAKTQAKKTMGNSLFIERRKSPAAYY